MGKWDTYIEETPASTKWDKYADTTTQTAPTPQTSPMDILKSIGMAGITPLMSQQQASKIPFPPASLMANPMYGAIAGATGLGTLPTPISKQLTSKMMSEQTSPLALISNLGIMRGLQARGELPYFPKLFSLGGRKTAYAIAQKGSKGLDKLNEALSNKYDTLFAKIDKGSTSVDDILETAQNVKNAYPEGSNMGKVGSLIKRLEEMKSAGQKIGAKELHNLKQTIRKIVPKSVWQGSADADAIQNAQQSLYWKVTEKLEEIGGKAYKGLTQEARNFYQQAKLARKMFQSGGIPTDKALIGSLGRGNYDIPTQTAVRNLSKQLPYQDQFANAFEAWRRGQGLKRNVGLAFGGGAGLYALHRYLTDKILGRNY